MMSESLLPEQVPYRVVVVGNDGTTRFQITDHPLAVEYILSPDTALWLSRLVKKPGGEQYAQEFASRMVVAYKDFSLPDPVISLDPSLYPEGKIDVTNSDGRIVITIKTGDATIPIVLEATRSMSGLVRCDKCRRGAGILISRRQTRGCLRATCVDDRAFIRSINHEVGEGVLVRVLRLVGGQGFIDWDNAQRSTLDEYIEPKPRVSVSSDPGLSTQEVAAYRIPADLQKHGNQHRVSIGALRKGRLP